MSKFIVDLVDDPEVVANRKLEILGCYAVSRDTKVIITYLVYYKTKVTALDLSINKRMHSNQFEITNATRVSSTGQQFSAGVRNTTFGVQVPFPVDITNVGAADTIAWNAATPEWDFIKNKMESTQNTQGSLDLLDYCVRRIQQLDTQNFFNTN